MAQRSLQLAAGLLLLVGLLGLSTALIAEVRQEVTERSQQARDAPAREVQEPRSGLPIPELTLLDPTRAQLPDRERTDDGVRLTGPGRVTIDPGETIRPAPASLTGTLVLADGWEHKGDALTCTTPCQLQTGDQELALPPNASVTSPGGEEIGAATVLEPGAKVPLPADAELQLPPVRFPAGTRLDLEPGARAHPSGPPSAWSSVFATETVELPAGTVVHRSAGGPADTEGLADLLDRARSGSEAPPEDIRRERPTITVTDAPDRIRKGEAFEVVGRVLGPAGEPLRDHPVTVYANATKNAPGIEIQTGSASTNAAGTFTASAKLPADAPTRPYHVLAHAHPRGMHDPPLAGAWSDPVVAVEGEADVRLDLPDRAGVDVPLPLEARLVDAYEAPIPNRTIVFAVEDTDDRLTARTGADGRAHAVLPGGLPFPGNYTITATFPGTENVTADATEGTIQAVEARIQAPAEHRAPRGEPTEIEGRVLTEDGEPGRVRLEASYGDVTATTDTDPRGAFTLGLPVPADLAPGNHTVELEAPAVDANRRLVLTATAGLQLRTGSPGPQPVGAQAPIDVRLEADNGTTMPAIEVHAHTETGLTDETLTDQAGQARLRAPMPNTGDHPVRLEVHPPNSFRPTGRNLTLSAAPLEVEADLHIAPGGSANGSLRLTVDDTPLTDQPVRLAGPSFVSQDRTDADGRAQVNLRAPDDAQPGLQPANLTLPDARFTTRAPLRILETPTLAVDVADEGRDGRPVQLAVTAEGRQGPLAGVPVIAQAEGAFEASDRAITGEDGTANLSLSRPDDAEGIVDIEVLARSTPTTAQSLTTASAEVTAAPLPWGWLSAAAAALGLAALVAVRRRQARTPTDDPDEASPISLRLAHQTPGDPPVWHPGEPTEILARARHDETITGTLELDGPEGTRRLELGSDGTARATVPARPGGTYTYRARLADDPARETVLDVRVGDYREEIDRAYRQLRRTATRHGLVGPDATPRELARALGPPADELARRFERYDYSPQPVDRDDYEGFMQLVREADPRG
ncbi:hypothetical protein BRD56_09695 [Thermoplasmatales archaeon SW_10_69_26]|nr:MAG: hypothetical protein BRD56_09695 [Thermoplasmatales archaeon SW_10_69_26]